MLYWGLIAGSSVLLPFRKGGKFNKNYQRLLYIFVCFVFILFAGLRSTNVGIDSNMYARMFLYVKSVEFNEGISNWQSGNVEIGYYVYEYLLSRFFGQQSFFFITSIISLIPIFIVIYRYSDNYFLSILLYICFGYYSFTMNGLRQSLAISICMIAFIFADKRKLIPFILTICLATLFHKSAVIFSIIFFIKKIRVTKTTFYFFLLMIAASFVFKGPIFNFINTFARQKYDITDSAGGKNMFLFLVFSLIVMFFLKSGFLEKEKNQFIYLVLFISAILWPITSVNAAVFRLYYYFHIFLILAIPNFLQKISVREDKAIFTFMFIFVGLYFLQFYIINSSLKYDPYEFFWE